MIMLSLQVHFKVHMIYVRQRKAPVGKIQHSFPGNSCASSKLTESFRQSLIRRNVWIVRHEVFVLPTSDDWPKRHWVIRPFHHPPPPHVNPISFQGYCTHFHVLLYQSVLVNGFAERFQEVSTWKLIVWNREWSFRGWVKSDFDRSFLEGSIRHIRIKQLKRIVRRNINVHINLWTDWKNVFSCRGKLSISWHPQRLW